ncbi:thymocyte nuclear protein 1-like protein [Basidiobolus meristosporus CBS 931.73]|uniref:Thymocyte nuclear protein 1 n=1 Tax=Basidiobolus meristosporus CBS 931.73 TaxID=1314790 RepID=A0A1Y1Y3A2_9FUNG|nr:thymocyte nuclear protein 1-like protein [Basidiobolus meristosporus CBS 931.73]|eukprot:ORX92468.1 thymocyte nuclear protein 1-like protein [Basidiobolus meristosporus CBS 931.73]
MSIDEELPRRSTRRQQSQPLKTQPLASSGLKRSNSGEEKPAKRTRTKKLESSNPADGPTTDGTTQTPECRYWLMKAEPNSRLVKGIDVKFSIDDLQACPEQTSSWEGVRNYEARNILRDQMKVGDRVLFYHSNCKTPGIAGLATIVKGGHVDHTAFDPKHPYYDPKSDPEKPKWYMVDVKYARTLKRFISLKELQSYKAAELSQMALINRGRLSVQPVKKEEFEFILTLEDLAC